MIWLPTIDGVESFFQCTLMQCSKCSNMRPCAIQVLYKGGMMQAETAEAIIKAIRAKASVKYGRARGMSGQGEGAKEYLGYLAQ